MMFMKRPNPGRLPPAEQRTAAEEALKAEVRAYYKAIEEPTKRLREALAAAAGPPKGSENDKKSLVTRQRMAEITQEADPNGEGLTMYAVRRIVKELLEEQEA